jgi:hypothetical protein
VTHASPWLRRIAVLALGVAWLACATPPTDEELETELRQIAARVKPKGELRVVALNAGSKMDAWAQLAESTAEGTEAKGSQLSRRLARAFSYANRRRIAVVTGGPFGDLNERTVLDAFAEQKQDVRLPGLTLVYVSPEPPSPELRAAAKGVGAALVHATPAQR